MKQYKRWSTALMLASAACAAVPVCAETVVNIPYEAGMPENQATCYGGYNTYGLVGLSSMTGECRLDFPISLPAGYTLKQISVLHNNYGSGAGFITAFIGTQSIGPPWGGFSYLFPAWASGASVPLGTVALGNLMGQSGSYFPDAFVTQSNVTYHVLVKVSGSAVINGLQVLYDPCIDCS